MEVASSNAATIGGGLGTPFRNAGAPTNGTSGTYVGCPVGARLTDTTNGKLYINTGTVTSVTWTVVGAQS